MSHVTRDEVVKIGEKAITLYRIEPLGSCGHRLEQASKDILTLCHADGDHRAELNAAYDLIIQLIAERQR